MYRLRLAEGVEDIEAWNSFVSTAKKNHILTIAHNPCLAIILAETFGYQYACSFVMEHEVIIGVLPGVYCGNKFVSMPHFSYGGPLFSEEQINKPRMQDLIGNNNYDIRSFDILSNYYSNDKVTSYLELEASIDGQWLGFKSKLRSQIKKGQKYSPHIFHGGVELLVEFYMIYTRNMFRLGSPPLPKLFFENIFKYYAHGDVNITLVKMDGMSVAAGMTLSYMKFSEVCWASSDYRSNKLNANMVLYWEMIKNSISRENVTFSFGRSSKDSGTLKFKRQWGVVVKPLYFNYSKKKNYSLKDNTLLPQLWRMQPIKSSILLGKVISKYIY